MNTTGGIETLRGSHWLTFNDEREVVGCHCGFRADNDSDCGWGDSVVEHLFAEAAREALMEAADLLAPLSGIGMGSQPTRTEVSTWLRARAALAAAVGGDTE